MPKQQPERINPELEATINELLKTARQKDCALEDRLKIVDRAMKFEQLKTKVSDGGFGGGFDTGGDE